MKTYRDELKLFLKCQPFIAAIIIVALLSYSFAATNITIGIDDLESERYVGASSVMLQAGRFGTFLWSRLEGTHATAFISDCLSIVLFFFASINLCILFRRVTFNCVSIPACTIFSCVLISYPLINEIWEYTGTNLLICGGMLFVALSLLLVHRILHGQISNWKYALGAVLLMTWVCSSYESVVPVYCFFVFAILALQIVYGTEKEKQLKEVLRQGLIYASIVGVALFLRTGIHRAYLLVTGTQVADGGATEIYWGTEPFLDTVKIWTLGTARTILHSIIYFPLTELLLAMIILVIIGIVACKKHGVILFLPGLGMFFSLIILSLIQGRVSPYRTCQVYGAFVAFVVMLVIMLTEQIPWKRKNCVRTVALILAAYLCFHQAVYLNYFLTLNHLRSEEEAYVIRQIGTDLNADHDLSKPVIFVGIYELSDYVQESASISPDDPRWKLYSAIWHKGCQLFGYGESYLSRKLPQTNVNSALRWAWYAYEQEAMHNLFSYYGCEYIPADYAAVFPVANQYAYVNQMPMYPQEGYIQDVGDYIIVCLGKV